jgi:hypothetical protein
VEIHDRHRYPSDKLKTQTEKELVNGIDGRIFKITSGNGRSHTEAM